MKTSKDAFAWMLDCLSGTSPNDERTSRINEDGFALCGIFYIAALAVRGTVGLLSGWNGAANHWDRIPVWTKIVSGQLDLPVLCLMLLIMLCITVRQRSKASPVRHAAPVRMRIAQLPRTAAALLSGGRADERSIRAFSRGFAVCGLIGIVYLCFCHLLAVWNWAQISTLVLLCAAPLPLAYVKLRENILTPPRFGHIRLSIRHLLLRLPLYLLPTVPYLLLASWLPAVNDGMGGETHMRAYSESLFVMFFQVLGDGLREWMRGPRLLSPQFLYYAAMIYLGVALVHEFSVFVYRRQMRQMDAEENDLS